MKDPADFEFEDELLQRQVKQAFDAVEPSTEASERILSNLLTYTQEKADTSASDQQDPQASSGGSREKLDADSAEAAGVVPAVCESAPAIDTPAQAADVVRDARETAPKPRRIIRPWQVLVPAAAVLAVLGIAVASGQLMGGISVPSAMQEASTETDSTAEEDSKQVAEVAEENALAPEGASQEPEGGSALLSEEATPQTSLESDADYQQHYGDSLEPIWAHEFPNIEAESGQRYVIDNPQAPVPANPATVGNLLLQATASGAEEGVVVPCAVYASLDESAEYLIAYNGAEEYFPAHAV